MGRARPDVAPDFRYSPVGSDLIPDREGPEGIDVVRVIHRARNLRAILHAKE